MAEIADEIAVTMLISDRNYGTGLILLQFPPVVILVFEN
jgi:hypothetical protein